MSRSVTFAKDVPESTEQQQQQQVVVVATPPGGGEENNTTPQQLLCPNCGSTEIEQHDASGASVCTSCGVVVEENAIVSAVEFVEGAGGASSMVGQFVSATSSKAYTGGPPGQQAVRGGRYGFSRDSRETTLANGRRRIQEVASRLRLGSHYVDAAHRLFTIAVEKNFVQGRRTTHVVAACLYIACRQEKSQHMLIDFSDALQVNVYTLGTCFLKFRRLLGLKLEIIDPALYVYRFAAHLELDEKANAVALTALRLVGRMKRDWIVSGRRPAGICAAALLIAARAHGFSKHHQDVTRILRVCGLTVTSRVKEFEQTPSASLTLDQFSTVDIETEADPPVYTRNKIREARAKAIQDGNVELLTSGLLDDRVRGKRAAKWRRGKKMNEKRVKFQELYQALEKELVVGEPKENNEDKDGETSEKEKEAGQEMQLVVHEGGTKIASVPGEWEKLYPRSKYGKPLIPADHATEEERQASAAPVEAKLNLNEWSQEMPEGMEDEFESIFRDEEEEKQREAIFNKINKDYLEQQERKESERLSAEAASKDQEKEDAVQAEGHARYKSNRKKRRRGEAGEEEEVEEPTTEEQLMAAVANRKISRKINYDALSSIFDEDGSFSTDVAEDGNNPSEDMYSMI